MRLRAVITVGGLDAGEVDDIDETDPRFEPLVRAKLLVPADRDDVTPPFVADAPKSDAARPADPPPESSEFPHPPDWPTSN